MKKIYTVCLSALLLMACNSPVKNNAAAIIPAADSITIIAKSVDSVTVYTAAMLDVKKDIVCGMPVTAGIADTSHYRGKAYGFCSKECKDEFLKNPGQYLSAK